MTDAPERIWAEPSQYPDELTATADKHKETDIEYIRKDVSDALVAAAYEDAAGVAVDWANSDVERPDDGVWMNVVARTPAEACAALDRIRQEARDEALQEAAAICAETPSVTGHLLGPCILDLITKDKTGR